MSKSRPSPEELLDRAISALREAPVPEEGLAEALMSTRTALARAMQERSAEPEPMLAWLPRRLLEGVRTMKTPYRFGVVAAVIVAILGLITWLSPGTGGGLLFADVLRKVREVRTATFTITVESEAYPPQTVKTMVLCPGRSRQEFMDLGMVMIQDAGRGQGVTLVAPTKHAIMVEYEPSQQPDFFEGLRDLRDGSEELLGTREIDGRMATGFYVRQQLQGSKASGWWDWTIWADPETGLPIRVEVEMDMELADLPPMNAQATMSDFEFDVDLDESLFSLDVPEGYSVIELDMSRPLKEQAEQAMKQAMKQAEQALNGLKGEPSDQPSTGEAQEEEQAPSDGEME